METSKQPVARLLMKAGECLLYEGSTVKLGRAAENDLVVNDPKVSRSHAELEWNGTGFTLRDLGSINGTFVNEQRVANTSRLLRDGDEIRLGRVTFIYEIIRAEPLEPPVEAAINSTGPLGYRGSTLTVLAGPDMGQEYPLWGEMITIGRASREATWEIRLTDRSVSRPHARLERREDGFYLLDLESANGTQLNGIPLAAPALLKDGDVIAVGETRMIFHWRAG